MRKTVTYQEGRGGGFGSSFRTECELFLHKRFSGLNLMCCVYSSAIVL